MGTTVVASWLERAGLNQYISNFSTVTETNFLQLLMQDYSKFGVVNIDDKTKLYRLIKGLNKEIAQVRETQMGQPSNPAAPLHIPSRNGDWHAPRMDSQPDILDLDAHDGDLLAHATSPTFQLSPVSGPKKQEELQPAAPQMAEEVDPPKIRVVVRKRPLNKKEKERGDEDIVEVAMGRGLIVVNETKVKVDLTRYLEKHQFNFDEALDESVTNDQVYKTTVQPLVHTLMRNGKASCFAYGQTGSGKTYTMSPLPTRAAADILRYLTMQQYQDISLYVSCFEIYGNKVFDLLNQRKKLNILEDGKRKVVVVGLKEHHVDTVDVVRSLIEESSNRRSVGSTAANSDSSRSHSIMQFALKRPAGEGSMKLVGKISFIDLAGSERGADTFDNNRQTRLEGAEINKSLLALKECIRALDADARHVPFRGSKLTAVLRDSFIGDQARTVMIANISPNSTSVEHTLNTLRYADRVKELRKDKVERTPGGVTPGDNPGYYAAVQRASTFETDVADYAAVASPRRDKSPYRPSSEVSRPSTSNAPGFSNNAFADDELISARDELMNTILEEEEDLVTAHRCQIEKTMELVRQEMQLLTEVDQPGSQIDQYVDKLEGILQMKATDVQLLQQRLVAFKAKLKEEEIMSKSVGPNNKWNANYY